MTISDSGTEVSVKETPDPVADQDPTSETVVAEEIPAPEAENFASDPDPAPAPVTDLPPSGADGSESSPPASPEPVAPSAPEVDAPDEPSDDTAPPMTVDDAPPPPAEPDSPDPVAEPDSSQAAKFSTGPPAIKARSVSSLPDDIGPDDFESAIAQTVLEFKEGDIIEGKVVNIHHDEVLVDIGYKSEGMVPLKELSIRKNVPPADIVQEGDMIEVLVLEKEDEQGRLILSKKRAQYERAWGPLEAVRAQGGTVKGVVIEVVKGGLIVDIGLRGFLPASLVDLRRVRDLDQFINQEIEAKVIELDRNRNNVVLSRRAHLEEEKAEQRNAFLDNLAEGEHRTGTISSVVNFGAFVDLGGMDGLVHVSELSWQHVNHPSEVVKVGEEVSVKVLEIDRDRVRISLSIKQTMEDPWESFIDANEVGATMPGTVIKTVPFGAFVSVGNGVEGLVHVSEIAMHRVESPEMELHIGQNVTVKLTELDKDRRRASFSIKQALPEFSAPKPAEGPRPPRRHVAPPVVHKVDDEADSEQDEPKPLEVDASLEEILKELKERGIGR